MPSYIIEHEGQTVEVTVDGGLPLSLAQHFEAQMKALVEGSDAIDPTGLRLVIAERERDEAVAKLAALNHAVAQMRKETDAAVYGKENAIWHRNKAVEILRAMESGVHPSHDDLVELLAEIDPTEDDLRARENKEGGSNSGTKTDIFEAPDRDEPLYGGPEDQA